MRIDVVLGVGVCGTRAGAVVGSVALKPARLAVRASGLRRLADEGRRSRARIEAAAAALVADRLLEMLLENVQSERAVEHSLLGRGLDLLVAQLVDSRFLDELAERALHSPEMDRLVRYVATSPLVVEAVSRHTQSLAEEMLADVRRSSRSVDDLAGRAIRGWLRLPRPATP